MALTQVLLGVPGLTVVGEGQSPVESGQPGKGRCEGLKEYLEIARTKRPSREKGLNA